MKPAEHYAGIERARIPTPALMIEMTALERNITVMASAAAGWRVNLRPHVKSHRCLPIAKRQIAAGACGVSCATLDEVAAMVRGKIPGILLTSPLAGAAKSALLGELLRQDPTVTLVADDPAGVGELEALSRGLGVSLRVLVDIDVGQRRTGCRTIGAAVALAKQVQSATHLEFGGIQAYAGHIQHIANQQERTAAATRVAEQVRELCRALTGERLAPGIITGAGTGSVEVDGPGGVYTELQPGSYVFLDTDYLAVESIGGRFAPSLFVDTTVISSQWEDHVTTDAGTRSFALNGPPPRSAGGEAGWTYSYDGDEFGRVTLAPGARRPGLGERLAFIVSHCDPTVVLYPGFVCVRGHMVEDCWPICTRGLPDTSLSAHATRATASGPPDHH